MQVDQCATGQAFERVLDSRQLRFKGVSGAGDPDISLLGQLLGQARLTGQSNESYRRSLRVRVLVRLSCGTLPDVSRVAEAAAREFGDGRWDTYRVDAHIIVVAIGQLDPDPLVRELVTQLVLDTIGEVDWLILYSLPQSPFTFDTPNLGWSQGLWAETVFASF